MFHAWRRDEAPYHGFCVVDLERASLLVHLDALHMLLFRAIPAPTMRKGCGIGADLQDGLKIGLQPWPDQSHSERDLDIIYGMLRSVSR